MERTIDVTICRDEADDSATVYFYDHQSGDRARVSDAALDDESAMRIGWEILSWLETMKGE